MMSCAAAGQLPSLTIAPAKTLLQETASISDQDDFLNEPAEQTKPPMSGCAKVAIGCGIVSGILLILLVIAGVWVSQNLTRLGADIGTAMMTAVVKEADLPEDQEQRIIARINEVGDRFKRGEINSRQVENLLKSFMDGPLLPASTAIVVKKAYIDKSGLTEEEIAAAEIAVQRFARGAVEQSIPDSRRDAVLDRISTSRGPNNRQFKQKLTDDELRQFIEDATAAADEAGVPEDVPAINFADEFDKVVDEAIGKPPAPQSIPVPQ